MNRHRPDRAAGNWASVLAAVKRLIDDMPAPSRAEPAAEFERTAHGVAALAASGLLSAPLRQDRDGIVAYTLPASVAIAVLSRLGGADLSLARLYEGHLNALQLIVLYGSDPQREALDETARAGVLYGVWGADGCPVFSATVRANGSLALSGAKRYASGLGFVTKALVPFTAGAAGMRMLLVDTNASERGDLSSWNMRGMTGSRSGTYDFEGVTVDGGAEVGVAGDYQREPYFVGGIWRCAAAQLGAVERLVALLVASLKASNRFDHPLQTARIGQAILSARTARLWIEDAAGRVEIARDAEAIDRAVSLSAYARLQTEAAGMTVVDLVERGIGLPAFAHGHPAEALSRDLAVYLRQANPDAVLLEHARVLAAQPLDS